jgi:polyisoprenoid-binding protein YceI
MPAQNEGQWSLDCFHSEISFKVRQLLIPNEKHLYKRFEADIYATSKDLAATCDIYWMDGSSDGVDSGKDCRRLKSANFFDVKKHRQITFISNSFYSPEDGLQHELSGELTMQGIRHL